MNEPSPDLSGRIIGAAIRVHETLGPGFQESVYEEALCVELSVLKMAFERQVGVRIQYRDQLVGEHRLDLMVEKEVVVELKAIVAVEPIHYAIMRSYLKATDGKLGLLLNFAAPTLQIKRVGREWHSKSPD
jgi:GxxExxY protein